MVVSSTLGVASSPPLRATIDRRGCSPLAPRRAIDCNHPAMAARDTPTMTTPNNSISTGTATVPTSERDTIGELLQAIEAGAVSGCQAYAPDAELDATVPNWRFSRRGADAILAV